MYRWQRTCQAVTTKPRREETCFSGFSDQVHKKAVQPQKMARCLHSVYKIEGLYYLCGENKGHDQIRGYSAVTCTAQLICAFVYVLCKKQVVL